MTWKMINRTKIKKKVSAKYRNAISVVYFVMVDTKKIKTFLIYFIRYFIHKLNWKYFLENILCTCKNINKTKWQYFVIRNFRGYKKTIYAIYFN